MALSIIQEANPVVRRTKWFFGIAINTYLEFPHLYNAVKDVSDIRQILIDEYGFKEENTFTLFDEKASEENIIGTLDDLANKLDTDDTLLIYYSGHGHMSNKGLGFWIPQDAKRGNTARYIPNSRIRDLIGTFDAQHVFLISDSCFSGSLLTKGTPRSTRLIRELDNSPSRWALCSGRGDEEVDDGIPGTNSPFALSIKNVLDQNHEPELNVSRLIDRVREQVAANSRQIPEGYPIQDVGHAWGEYIFRKTNDTAEHIGQATATQVSGQTEVSGSTVSVKTETHTSHKHSSWLKPLFSVLIVIMVSVVIWFLIMYLSRNALKVKVDALDNSVEIRAGHGTPWKSRGGYVDGGSYNLLVRNVDGREVYSTYLYEYADTRYAFVLFQNGISGKYTVTIQDSLGTEIVNTFTIPNTYKPAVQVFEFHTTSGIQPGPNPWPVDQQNKFKPGQMFYAYANVMSSVNTEITFKWVIDPMQQKRYNISASSDPARLTDSFSVSTPGRYWVKLYSNEGEIAQTWYTIVADPTEAERKILDTQ